MSDLCEHCGHELRGLAMVGDALVCHPVDPYPDCYRLVTVYGETLGSRNVRRLRAAVDEVLALHQPLSDGPFSLIDYEYCSCRANEVHTDDDGSRSIGPAKYPCPTRRALAPVADPGPHTTSDEETTT